MVPFLYYLPGVDYGTLDRDGVARAGLGETFRDCLVTQRAFQDRIVIRHVHSNGPGEVRSGVIVCAQPGAFHELETTPGYFPDRQTWRKISDRLWIGWEGESFPEPQSLRRQTLIIGAEHTLGDDRVWTCPIVRRYGVSPSLPKSMGLDEHGRFAMRVLPEWEWAWQLSDEIFERISSNNSIEWEEAFRLAVGALSINYRIGPFEASLMGLITTENFQLVFEAVVDWEAVKKLLPEAVE